MVSGARTTDATSRLKPSRESQLRPRDLASTLSGCRPGFCFQRIRGISTVVARGRSRMQRSTTLLRLRPRDRKSTRLNSSHTVISYAVFCLKKKKKKKKKTKKKKKR